MEESEEPTEGLSPADCYDKMMCLDPDLTSVDQLTGYMACGGDPLRMLISRCSLSVCGHFDLSVDPTRHLMTCFGKMGNFGERAMKMDKPSLQVSLLHYSEPSSLKGK